MNRQEAEILLHKAFSVVVFAVFVGLLGAGVWVAWRYGVVAGYVGFAWVVPLAGLLWWNFEFEMFGISPLNTPFILAVLWGSFVLSVVCFPLIVVTQRGMSTLALAGVAAGALLNAVPFWVYVQLKRHPPR